MSSPEERVRTTPSSEIAELTRIDLNVLVSLYLILAERSVSHAAARAGLSQPAMSHALARGRRLLKDELLVRVGNRLEPTARGLSLHAALSQSLQGIRTEILRLPVFDPSTSARTFRISATTSTALVVMPPLLKLMQDLAPGITLELLPGLHHANELQSKPDVDVLLLADRVAASVPREHLYWDRWVLACGNDHPEIREGASLEALARWPHIRYQAGQQLIQPYDQLNEMGVQVNVHLRTTDFALLPLLVSGGTHLAIVQEKVARSFVRSGLIRTFELPFETPPLGMDLLCNPRFARDPARPWLTATIRAAAPTDLPGGDA